MSEETKLDNVQDRTEIIQHNLDLMKSQLDIDRGDIEQMKIKMATIEEQNKQILQRFQRMEESMADAVGRSVKLSLAPLKTLINSIVVSKKKVVIVQKDSWMKRTYTAIMKKIQKGNV